jgi:hypothetical protein
LPVASQPAVVFATAEMLHENLFRRVIDDFADNSRSRNRRPADFHAICALVKENPIELQLCPAFRIAKVYTHHIPFAYPVLTGTILKHCVHRLLRILISLND